ncbi:unnamed protein product [Ixodes pacificus]
MPHSLCPLRVTVRECHSGYRTPHLPPLLHVTTLPTSAIFADLISWRSPRLFSMLCLKFLDNSRFGDKLWQ